MSRLSVSIPWRVRPFARLLAAAAAALVAAAAAFLVPNWWNEQREGERTHYTGNFDEDEESYRRGYTAALHPQRRDKAYSDVEDELRTQYANTVLDRPFQSGYERGLNHRSRGAE